MSSTLGVAAAGTAGVTVSTGGVMGADLSGMVAATATITSTTTGTVGQDASDVIALLDAALTGLESQRATFGAMQNRLEYAVDNLTNVSQNTSASLSRIQDADYAAETSELARTQIISQAATAMLSQANQQAQSVLALLK
jgi:flagellin